MTTRIEHYTVGWISAIPIELGAARELLDEEYGKDKAPKLDSLQDDNSYTFGRIHEHNVVIACLAYGRYGATSAAAVAKDMFRTFPSIRIGLMVGIAGGAPTKKHDIRLGDVVVSSPTPKQGGVLQYDYGKAIENREFEITSYLSPPPPVLLNAIANIVARHQNDGHQIKKIVADMLARKRRLQVQYGQPDIASDKLYEGSLPGEDRLVIRRDRSPEEDNPAIHYGLIASANRVLKDRQVRDALAAKYEALCFEMEAAGVMNDFPCLVIRGICDYCDLHKNDDWHGYAAATAAAYAKELLGVIPTKEISSMLTIAKANNQCDKSYGIPFSLAGIPIAKKFVDRPEEMQKLKNVLLPNDQDTHRRLFVLRGLGGMGKTQLAVKFMRQHHARFSAVLWIDGSSSDSLKQSIAQHASRIPSDQISMESRSFVTSGDGDINVVVAEVLNWLQTPNNTKWLIIFDNVDREYLISEPLSYDIKQYIPAAEHGSILITTRLVQLERLGESQDVRRVDDETAATILKTWYNSAYDESHIKALLERLDGMPLAIAQAGAYLNQKGMGIETYLRLYDKQEAKVAEALHQSKTLLDDYPNRSVWTTWSMSFDAIRARDEHVAKLLILWSFLDRRGFWFGLFERSREWSSMAEDLQRELGDIPGEELVFIEAMGLLYSYSLIERSENANDYMMHTLVHRWVYFYHGLESRSDIGRLALSIVGLSVPDRIERDYAPLQQLLLPHADMCCLRVMDTGDCMSQRQSSESNDESLTAHDRLGVYFTVIGRLGTLYEMQGKPTKAQAMYERALEGRERVYGAEHLSTLESVNALANFYMEQNKMIEVVKMYERVLRGCEKEPDAMAIEILYVKGNLGVAYQQQGKMSQAEEIHKQTMREFQAIFGTEHIRTIESMSCLADLYVQQGKLDEAEKMYHQSIKGFEKAVGAEHTLALQAVHDLAILYKEQGKLDDAEKAYQRALAGYERALGVEHPDTLTIVTNIGLLYKTQGKPNDAEKWLQRALVGQEKALGAEHTSTLETIHALGVLYYDEGKLDDAEKMLQRALTGYENALGAELIKTDSLALGAMCILGVIWEKSRPDKAKVMYEKALAGFSEVLGVTSDECIWLAQHIEELDLVKSSENQQLEKKSSRFKKIFQKIKR